MLLIKKNIYHLPLRVVPECVAKKIYLDFCPSGQGDIKCLHVYSSQIIIEHILGHLLRSLKMGIIAEKFAYLQKKQ